MEQGSRSRLLTRLRAEDFQPFIRATDTVLEYGVRDATVLAEIAAGRKIAFSPERRTVGENIETTDDLGSLSGVDVVICDHSLEYLSDPGGALVTLKGILRPGGRLVACALYDPGFRRPCLDQVAEHLYSWNVQTLGNLIVNCGFEFESGRVRRCPNEKLTLRLSRFFGTSEAAFRTAAAVSRVLDPARAVWVTALRP